MSTLNRFNDFISKLLPGCAPYDFTNKEQSIQNNVMYMLSRTRRIFEYEGLPDTIPARMFEWYLQTNGNVCITSIDDNLYAFFGELGGELDMYYQPTLFTVANPYLNFNANLKVDVDCVIVFNDSAHIGLMPMLTKNSTLLMENEISMNMCSILSRTPYIINANNDNSARGAIEFLKDILNGRLGIIKNRSFANDDINIVPNSGQRQTLTELIEYNQYIKASLFNELGLNANYNMKRESINSNESQLNEDALRPFIDDMLEQRIEGLEKINKMFGTNISVKLSSSWEVNEITENADLETMLVELDKLKEEDGDEPKEEDNPGDSREEDEPGEEV